MKSKPKNILITGGSGFIGSHIVDQCIERGYNVKILDIKEPHRNDVEFINGDVTDRPILTKIMVDIDYIYHLAAVSNIDYVIDKPIETIEYNIMGTAFLLEEARKNQIKRFFLASSVFVYEKSGHLYTSSKQYSEILCNNYFLLYGIPYTILRFATVYGPRSRGVDVISKFVKNAFEGKSLIVNGQGTQKRNFIYVKDLARGSVRAINATNTANKILTIAGKKSISIIDLAKQVNMIFNESVKIESNNKELREHDYKGDINDIDKTYLILGWEPKVSLNNGIKKYAKWYSSSIFDPETKK